jgi:hypothetical protein
MRPQHILAALALACATLLLGGALLVSPPARAQSPAPPNHSALSAGSLAEKQPLQGTPTPTATACAGSQMVNGSITASSPTHTGYVNLLAAGHSSPGTCQTPETCPGVAGAANYHYDLHSFTNPSASPQCVTVTVNPAGCGSSQLWAFA